MESFTPEFAAFWQTETEDRAHGAPPEPREATSPLSPSQQLALEELVERVSAARSVI